MGERTAGALGGALTVALPEGAMSVTALRIMTPSGAQVEGVGVAPDTEVNLTESDMERGEDTQLRAALQVLIALRTAHLLLAAQRFWRGHLLADLEKTGGKRRLLGNTPVG